MCGNCIESVSKACRVSRDAVHRLDTLCLWDHDRTTGETNYCIEEVTSEKSWTRTRTSSAKTERLATGRGVYYCATPKAVLRSRQPWSHRHSERNFERTGIARRSLFSVCVRTCSLHAISSFVHGRCRGHGGRVALPQRAAHLFVRLKEQFHFSSAKCGAPARMTIGPRSATNENSTAAAHKETR